MPFGILHTNCLITRVVGEKIEGTGRRGRRCKRVLGGLEKNRRYWNAKDEALDRTI